MLRSTKKTESRRNLSLLLSLGMVLGFALLVGMYGCPGTTPPPPPPSCDADADCDDGVFCNGAETCNVASGDCVDAVAPCAEGEVCDEEGNQCVECLADADCGENQVCRANVCLDVCAEDADCDDGAFCNGAETCVDGACEPGTAPCAEGEQCDEAGGQCVTCLDDADCGADEICVDGECVPAAECATDADCPGQFEECIDGECVEIACVDDVDCDDGLYCNGLEACSNGLCQAGTAPCDPVNETCEEGDTAAECIPSPVDAIVFTLGQDNLLGTSADNVFSAPLDFNAGTGTQLPTLQNGDFANGLAGDDTLNATYTHAINTTIQPELVGIEMFNITDFTPTGVTTTFSMTNVTDVTDIYNLGSSADAVTITNLTTLSNLGVTNSASDLTITWIAPATNANDDAISLALNGAKVGCTVTMNTPANGIETLSIETAGSASTLDALVHAGAATLTTLEVLGDQNLIVTGVLPATLTTVNAGTADGNTELSLGGVANVTYTGGNGDDVVLFDVAGGYTTGDTIDGGTGSNTLGVQSAEAVAATTAQNNVSNIDNLRITDGLNGAINVTRFGATNAVLDTVAAATNLLAGASTITLPTGSPAVTLNNDDTGANTLGVTVTGSSTSDTLAFDAMNADLGGTLTLTGAETVNYMSANGADGTAADGNVNTATAITLAPTFGAGVLNFTGSVAVTLSGAITGGTINASALTAPLTMGAATVAAGGATITGSALNDTLLGSVNSDSINGGDGVDTITAGAGGDNLVGGTAADNFRYAATTDGGAADAGTTVGADILADFAAGASGDVLAYAAAAFQATATGINFQTTANAANGTTATGVSDPNDNTVLVVIVGTVSFTDYASFETFCNTTLDGIMGINNDAAVVVCDITGVGQVVAFDPDLGTANDEVILGGYSPTITLGSLVAANFGVY